MVDYGYNNPYTAWSDEHAIWEQGFDAALNTLAARITIAQLNEPPQQPGPETEEEPS